MYWLIETDEQLENFTKKQYKDVFVEVIPFSNNVHPVENQICAVYLKPLSSTKGYMVTIAHSEALSINIDKVKRVLSDFKNIYVRDRKEFIYYFKFKNTFDINSSFPPYIQKYTAVHSHFYYIFPDDKQINRIVPIVKHYEWCEQMWEELKDNVSQPLNSFYNKRATLVFAQIEQNGIKVDPEKYLLYFKTKKQKVHTQYNFKTLTTRPSNIFNKINYGALNKTNGERACFLPNNDFLLDVDITAYHPTLLSKLISYSVPDGQDIYESLGMEREKAKKLILTQMYKGVDEKYEHIEFFKKTKQYTQELWDKFQTQGYIECEISKHRFYRDKLENMRPSKLLSYVLQNLETSYNIVLMEKMLKLLKGKNTKLILYNYDAFLFDVDKSEKQVIKEIFKLFENKGLKVKYKYGADYNFE